MNRLIIAAIALFAATCDAAPPVSWNACYVRAEPTAPAAPVPAAADAAVGQSFVGVRRQTQHLFELDISVNGPGRATCSLAGVARIRGEPGQEVLAMAVRRDPAAKVAQTGAACQVFVQLTATALELRTTPDACRAQSLCEGKVELDGQRFESATRLPDGTQGPCFERRAP